MPELAVASDVTLDQVRVGYRRTHEALLDVAAKTDESAFHKPAGTANSIGFNLWHVARWADSLSPRLGGAITGLRAPLGEPQQIWIRENLAQRWQLPSDLGGG